MDFNSRADATAVGVKQTDGRVENWTSISHIGTAGLQGGSSVLVLWWF